MRVEDTGGYNWFLNKYEIKYIEEIESDLVPCCTAVNIVFKDGSNIEMEIPMSELEKFDDFC